MAGSVADRASTDAGRLEVELVVEAVRRRWGFDLGRFDDSTVKRRLQAFRAGERSATLAALIPRLLWDRDCFARLAGLFATAPAAMFRPLRTFTVLRHHLAAVLRARAEPRVWLCGCGNGEPAYGVAIVLKEAGLLDRTIVYATDADPAALGRARDGRYAPDRLAEFVRDYQATGGRGRFSSHGRIEAGCFVADPALRARITFARHHPALDAPFATVDLVIGRTILAGLDRDRRAGAIGVILASLAPGGYLSLGKPDSAGLAGDRSLTTVDRTTPLFRRDGAAALVAPAAAGEGSDERLEALAGAGAPPARSAGR